MTINPNWFSIVRRTAQHGLDESLQSSDKFYHWLSIWALDVVCESVEFMEAEPDEDLVEAGDVLWGVAASAMLLGITQDEIVNNQISSVLDLISCAAAYADRAKKVARDQRLVTQELPKLRSLLIDVFSSLVSLVDVNQALEAVDQKLQKRYPNGYTADDSINRVV